jgi:hypothetical protein
MSYSIQLPDGRRARFPDSIPLEEAQQIVRRDFPDLFPKQGGIAGALKKSTESLVSSGLAGLTGLVNPEQAAREALERERSIGERYKDETSLDALKERYQKEGLFAAGKELVRQVPLAVAEQLPQVGVSLGGAFTGARLGAMAGSVAGPVGAGVGATVGGLAGTFAPSYLQQFGTNLSRQAAEGKTIDASSAAAAAAAQAGIETAAGAFILGKQMVGKLLGRPAEKALDSVAGRALAEQSLKRTLATGAARATAVEVPTEVTQAMLERLQAGLPLTSDDALKEYGDTAYKTALSAPVFGGAARVGERGAARAQVETEDAAKRAEEQQRQAAEDQQRQAFKRTPEYMQQLNQEQVQLKDEIRQLNDLLKDKTLDPTQKLEAQDRRKDIGKRLKEINDEIRTVVPARPVSELLAARQMEQEAQGAPVVDEFGNVVSTSGKPFDALESKGKEILRAPRSDVDVEAQIGPGYDTEINKLRVAEEKRVRELQESLREAYERSVAAGERKDAKEKAEYDKLIASIAKQAEKGKERLIKSQIPMDMQMPFADAYDALTQAAEQTQVGTYDEALVDQILQKIEGEQPKATVKAQNELALEGRSKVTNQIQDLQSQREKAVQARDKETIANLDAQIAELRRDQAAAAPDFATKRDEVFLDLESTVDDLRKRRYFGVTGEAAEASSLAASLQKKATALKGDYVNTVLQEIAQTRADNNQTGLNKDEELAVRARLDGLLQEYITRSQALSAKEIKDGLDQVVEKKREFAPRDVQVLTQLQNRIKSNADAERALAERIAKEPNEKLQKQLDALGADTSQIVNTFLQRLTEPLKVRVVEVLRRPSDTRPLGERPFGAPKRAYDVLQEGLNEVRETYMRPERVAAPQLLKTEFPGYKLAPAAEGEPTKSRVVVTRDEKEEKVSDTGRVRRKIEQAELKLERVRAMGEIQPAVESAFDTFERMDKPSEALVDLVLEQADRILKGIDLPFKPSADITRRAKRPGAQNTAELLPQIQEAIKAEAPAPEVGEAQMDLFGEKELEPRAITRKTPEGFMRFLGSLQVSTMRKRLDDAKKQAAELTQKQKDAARTSKENLDRLINSVGQNVSKIAMKAQRDAVESINVAGLKDLQTLAQMLSQELATKTRQYKNIVEKANRAEYYIPDKDRAAADEYLADLRSDLEAVIAEIKDAAPTAEDKLLVNTEVALNKRLQSEKKLLAELKAERETRTPKRESEQAVVRRNIAVIEATQRRLADLRAKNKQLLEQRLGELPGIRRGTETVSVLDEVGRGKTKRIEVVERERRVVTPVGKGAEKVERRAEPLDLSSTAAEAYALTAKEEQVLSPAEAAQTLLRGTRQGITATGAPGATTEQIRKQRLKPLRGGESEKAAKNIAEASTLRQRTAGKKAQTDKDLLKLIKAFEEGIARQNDDTAFRVEEVGDTVVDLAEAQKRIDEFKSKLPENVKFVYAESIMDAPKSFIQALYNQGMDQDSATVRGGVLPDGTIVVIGENHTDMLDLEKTLAHELVGHYGVDTLLGPKGMDNLVETVNAQKGGMEKLASDLGVYDAVLGTALKLRDAGASEKQQQRAAMRELIAHVEEARIDENFKQAARRFIGELIGAVRAALRKMGLATLAEQNPTDIYFLLRQSRINMTKDKAGAYIAGDQVVFRNKPRYSADVPENVIRTANKVVAAPPGVFDKVKANNSWLAVRTQFIDRFEPLERVAAEMKDSLKATQMMYYLRMFDQRMSFTSEVTNNGALVLDKQKRADGKEEIVVRSGGTTSLKDVANELGKATSLNADAANMLFTTYLAALRADRVGLDTLNFNPDLTQKDLDEVKAYVERTPDVKAAFTAARTKYNEYNKGLVNFLVQTGTLSKESGKKLSDTNDYIPFYRKQGGNAELVLGGEISPINVGSLKSQPYLNELVGDNRHILDFFTSSVQNTNLLTDMALRNLATRNVAFGLGEMGLLSRTDKEVAANKSGIRKGKDAKGSEVIRFKIDGEDYYAEADTETLGIPSDLLVKGLEGISMTVPAAVRMLGIPAQILRKFITRNPVYALRQIIRDSTAAVMVSGANMTPVASSLKELVKMRQGKSEGEKVLQERGILGGQVLTGTPEDISKILKELVDGGKGWTQAMAKLDNFAVQGDAATRVVMYKDFRKQGLSDMEATLATLESMNFNRRGLSPSVFMLSMMVPFMNAQIQGMDVLYRAFTGKMPFNEQLKVREKLISRGLMLAGITLAYAAMMEDDETYKNADPTDRYMNFFVHTPFFDEAVRIPIPFEIGYIFKALPEMVYNTAFGDTELKQIAPAIRKILSSLVPGDIPAGIKPMIELMTNYSFYSGKAIESEREQALVPAERYRAGTTEVSKAIGGLFGVSPIKLDYMIRGYTGGLGVAIASIANPVLAANEKVAPEMRASDTPVIGGLFQPKDAQGLINYAYDLVTDIEQKQRTMKTMQERGRPEDVKTFIEENRQDLKLADTAGSFKRFMGELAKLERNVRERTDMTPQQKREKLDEIRQRRIKTAQRMVSLVGESKLQDAR